MRGSLTDWWLEVQLLCTEGRAEEKWCCPGGILCWWSRSHRHVSFGFTCCFFVRQQVCDPAVGGVRYTQPGACPLAELGCRCWRQSCSPWTFLRSPDAGGRGGKSCMLTAVSSVGKLQEGWSSIWTSRHYKKQNRKVGIWKALSLINIWWSTWFAGVFQSEPGKFLKSIF